MTSKHFKGANAEHTHLVRPRSGLSGEIWKLLQRVESAFTSTEQYTRTFHEPIITPRSASSAPAKQPTPVLNGLLLVSSYTLNTDDAFRQIKIPSNFAGNPSVHIHWTKTSDANEQAKAVRWRVSYNFFQSTSTGGLGNAVGTVFEIEDTYDASDTTNRQVYRTDDTPLIGAVAGYYLNLKVEAVTPVGTPLAAEPGLFALDLLFDEFIND